MRLVEQNFLGMFGVYFQITILQFLNNHLRIFIYFFQSHIFLQKFLNNNFQFLNIYTFPRQIKKKLRSFTLGWTQQSPSQIF